MFGEKSLIGQYKVTVDEKGRIAIPASTKAEVDDELTLMYDNDLEVFRIYNSSYFDMILENLESRIYEARNKDEEIFFKRSYYAVAKSILKICTLDKNRRFLVGDTFKPYKKLLLIGAKNHLIIEPIKKEK